MARVDMSVDGWMAWDGMGWVGSAVQRESRREGGQRQRETGRQREREHPKTYTPVQDLFCQTASIPSLPCAHSLNLSCVSPTPSHCIAPIPSSLSTSLVDGLPGVCMACVWRGGRGVAFVIFASRPTDRPTDQPVRACT
mmetsp:Transcript_12455/g.29707  ORF Transcript_12455/g.29707 Transcript_12455/m.29707 type:complete len:139 (-) Transcript_12455:104-520(-)